MKTFKQYFTEDNSFEDMFGFKPEDTPKVVKKDPPKTREITLILYRGFDADLESLEQHGDKYILSPDKSEQQAIWFSQRLSDAQGRGEWILEFPLKATKHYVRKHKEDGSYYDVTPEDISSAENSLENSSTYGGVELPEGWYWSYKTQKYIIATVPIKVTKDMIKRDKDYENI